MLSCNQRDWGSVPWGIDDSMISRTPLGVARLLQTLDDYCACLRGFFPINSIQLHNFDIITVIRANSDAPDDAISALESRIGRFRGGMGGLGGITI